jgi:hypothetical protein
MQRKKRADVIGVAAYTRPQQRPDSRFLTNVLRNTVSTNEFKARFIFFCHSYCCRYRHSNRHRCTSLSHDLTAAQERRLELERFRMADPRKRRRETEHGDDSRERYKDRERERDIDRGNEKRKKEKRKGDESAGDKYEWREKTPPRVRSVHFACYLHCMRLCSCVR